jgi:thioredoxin-dependent peroxiredoxin
MYFLLYCSTAVQVGIIVVIFSSLSILGLYLVRRMVPLAHPVYPDQTTPVKLSDYRGQTVALYFYPKDFTPGCTTEACTFRDSYAKLHTAGIVLLGCSVDTADAHRAFIKKYRLPFPLLLDPDKKIANAYGAANGIAKYGLDGRVTYVIGGDGKILKVYPKVDPALNASEIISPFDNK